jgi:hypothetical protein
MRLESKVEPSPVAEAPAAAVPAAPPGAPAAPVPAPAPPGAPAAPAPPAAPAEKAEPKGYLDLLVTAIPTEPLALYTFLIAGIVTTIEPGSDQRLEMRWAIFAVTAVFIAIWMIGAHRREGKGRRLPLVEIACAVVAFSAWALVMPESPLTAELSGTNQTVWTFIITAAGAALVGLFTGSMKKPASTD